MGCGSSKPETVSNTVRPQQFYCMALKRERGGGGEERRLLLSFWSLQLFLVLYVLFICVTNQKLLYSPINPRTI